MTEHYGTLERCADPVEIRSALSDVDDDSLMTEMIARGYLIPPKQPELSDVSDDALMAELVVRGYRPLWGERE